MWPIALRATSHLETSFKQCGQLALKIQFSKELDLDQIRLHPEHSQTVFLQNICSPAAEPIRVTCFSSAADY